MSLTSAQQRFQNALLTRNEGALWQAVYEGVSPDTPVQGHTALEWAVAHFYPLTLIRGLVERGAGVRGFDTALSSGPLGAALQAGNAPPAIFLMEKGVEVQKIHWEQALKSPSPHVMLGLLGVCPFTRREAADWAQHVVIHNHPLLRPFFEKKVNWGEIVLSREVVGHLKLRQMQAYWEAVEQAHRQGQLVRAALKKKTTPFHRAESPLMLKEFLKRPEFLPLLDFVDASGRTALMAHLQKRRVELVGLLLNAGARAPALEIGESRSQYLDRVLPAPTLHDRVREDEAIEKMWAIAQAQALNTQTQSSLSFSSWSRRL